MIQQEPPMTLPTTKKPVASQLASAASWLNLHKWSYSEELKDALGIGDDFDADYSPLEMYEVLSVTSHGNAALLVIAGHKSRHAALKCLNEHGFAHLIVDSSETVAQALDRRISVTGYMDSEKIIERGGDHVMDAVEVSASTSLQLHEELVEAVRLGRVPLADLKKLGFTLLSQASQSSILEMALSLQSPDPKITIEGAKKILKRGRLPRHNTAHVSLLLQLGIIYGDKVCEITDPGTALREHRVLLDAHPELDEDTRYKVMLFMTEIDAYRTFFPHEVPRLTVDDQLDLYYEGVNVEEHFSGAL
jgi:hypothetical protein